MSGQWGPDRPSRELTFVWFPALCDALSHTRCHAMLLELGQADGHILERKSWDSEGPADLPEVTQQAPSGRGTRTWV